MSSLRNILTAALFAVLTVDGVSADTLEGTLGLDRTLESRPDLRPEDLLLKDPMIAGLMSASLPGLGQWYAGQRMRGFLFLVATGGAIASTAAFVEPARLDLADYDRVEYGGNGDGLFSVEEVRNWENHEYEDNAFEALSTGRKVGAITSGAAVIGLWIWNIIDARSAARDYNREALRRRINLGLLTAPDRTGLALHLSF